MFTKFTMFMYVSFFMADNVLAIEQEKRHIIFIVADDWGWGHFGIHGSNVIQTPNMDTLAYSGVILQNYYTASLCSPSRSALMTGLHQVTTGMQHGVLQPGYPEGLPLKYKILPQYLKEEGYKTYAVGKWHLGDFRAAYTPTQRGFDYHFGYWEGRQSYYTHQLKASNRSDCYDMRRGMNVSSSSYKQYATDIFTDEAINIIRTHNTSTPMFLYVAHLAVHAGNVESPLEAPSEIINKFQYIQNPQLRTFAAMVWKLDDSIGKIIAALGRDNMLTNSIIVLTTDNGGAAHGYDQSVGSNWPLRGGKGSQFEGGVRGNAVVWARELPPSKTENHLMHLQDWLPTLLGAINSTLLEKNNVKLDGRNLWSVFKGEQKSIYEDLLLQLDPKSNAFAYRRGDYKILHGQWVLNKWYNPSRRENPVDYSLAGIEESPVSLTFTALNIPVPSPALIQEIRNKVNVDCSIKDDEEEGNTCEPATETCLFNVRKDPCERNNLAKNLPDVVYSLMIDMKKFNVTIPHSVSYDPRSDPANWNFTCTNWCDHVPCVSE